MTYSDTALYQSIDEWTSPTLSKNQHMILVPSKLGKLVAFDKKEGMPFGIIPLPSSSD